MIIGITGTFSSGKDTVAKYLESKGWTHVATGDIVREEVVRRGLPLGRDNERQVANDMRQKLGPGWTAAEALKRVRANAIVSGLRNIDEIRILKEHARDQFILIAVDAPVRMRWERGRARGRIGDDVNLGKFIAQEKAEKSGDPSQQQLTRVIAMADVTIQNDGTEEELCKKVDGALAELSGR